MDAINISNFLYEAITNGHLLDVLYIFVLAFTGFWIARQTIATRKLVEFSTKPNYIEIGLKSIYVFDHKEKRKVLMTRIFLFNPSDIPTLVWTKFKLTREGKKISKEESNSLGTRFLGKVSWPAVSPHKGWCNSLEFAFLDKIINKDTNNITKIGAFVDIYLASQDNPKSKLKMVSKYYKLKYIPESEECIWADQFREGNTY